MDTTFLSSWQGVAVSFMAFASIITLIIFLIRNVDKLKGVKVDRNGVTFGTVDLSNAIPRIDNQTKVRLQSVVKDIIETSRATINISGFEFHCNNADIKCNNYDMRLRILKMLLVSRMVAPLYDSISRNHLVKLLSGNSAETWIKQISTEIHDAFMVIEDYCGIDLPDEPLMKSIEKILRDFYIPRARSILLEGVYAKLEAYNRLEDTDKRKEKLIQKCELYIEGLA